MASYSTSPNPLCMQRSALDLKVGASAFLEPSPRIGQEDYSQQTVRGRLVTGSNEYFYSCWMAADRLSGITHWDYAWPSRTPAGGIALIGPPPALQRWTRSLVSHPVAPGKYYNALYRSIKITKLCLGEDSYDVKRSARSF